ncbi:MAG TPA: hypothetical protein VHE61_05115 [Opitutaceae bacterium]|nr:hypothetical protein [Opitutaceae bacterium]
MRDVLLVRACLCLIVAGLSANPALAASRPLPRVTVISPAGEVTLAAPGAISLRIGDKAGDWTLMAVINQPAGESAAVFEDFTDPGGRIVVAGTAGLVVDLPKSLAPSAAEARHLYRGHTLAEVLNSDDDLLGGEILAQPGDPSYAEVAACFPPISRMGTYTFVGTRKNYDKVPFDYGGHSSTFDPAVYVPAIRGIRDRQAVEDGLVGGWLPVVRFVYPEPDGAWTELLAYAPFRMVNGNRWAQPVWYRVARVEHGRLAWVRYIDTYPPFPPRTEQPPAPFYQDLLAMKAGWEHSLAGGMQVSVPEPRVADMARHSLVRAMITRMGVEPKYGVANRNYGATEHDGFPDTFNTDTGTLCDWGLLDLAGKYIDNYFGKFVRDDGSILYRGPEIGQYGRMLTVVAQFVNDGGDPRVVLRQRARIDGVTRLLLALRRKAQTLPVNDPAYGMISGWSEADSSIDPDPPRYMQPYFGNSAEAARGFHDLGRVWQRLGRERHDAGLAEWGAELVREAGALKKDLQQSIVRSLITTTQPVCLPAIAGAKVPFHIAVAQDPMDPLHRSYRSYMEMQFSGLLTREEVGTIIRYRAAHRDSILGLPTAYGYNTHEVAGFLTYGQAYGLLQHDFVREYLLTLYSLMAHQYTRGTWTAPETRRLDADAWAAPYCVPAQLTVPMLTRWMLAFEDPNSATLWLAKATPRDWLADGKVISARDVPTRWGRMGFTITSHLAAQRIEVEIDLPTTPFAGALKIRLRVPGGHRLSGVTVNGTPTSSFNAADEVISLPGGLTGRLTLAAMYDQEGR